MVERKRNLVAESLESRQLMAAVSLDTVWDQHSKRLTAPMHVTEAAGVRAAEIRIQYDPSVLTTDEESIRAGAIWEENAALVVNVDEEQGTIVAFLYTAESVPADHGDLIEIDFEYASPRSKRMSTKIDVQEVELNEGAIALDQPPVIGDDDADAWVSRQVHRRHHAHWRPPFQPSVVDTVLRDRFDDLDDRCQYGPQLPRWAS
ncbi:hypothetical protein LOC67_11340 [Stieleria sp. JC731]|uniref:cohesin domain-containing protein n=1 Tax=Pirellulaceae TaxID=2691357 RepID=UPI001E5885EF|nr:cohesin domain-containing protein [Stieleria sp. JC731]MCC9601139.1 hypothetical protein [Stieleria sp. JC731]